MRYVSSRYVLHNRDEIYRIYVTDALRVYGHLSLRYADLVKDFGKPSAPKEDAESIKNRMKEKMAKLTGGS